MSETVVPIQRALLSVFDKSGLIDLARALSERGVDLLASGGTYGALVAAGFAVDEVAAFTGQPEILSGRVKTLHPKIHAGILARRNVPADLAALAHQGFALIDLVVVNLYPFEATAARREASFDEVIENIDIGGPSLIRAAAKNHDHVAVVTSPDQYPHLIAAFAAHGGTTLALRRRFALEAFRRTASYDAAIAEYLGRPEWQLLENAGATSDSRLANFPASLELRFALKQPLRYGENPHQQAAFYAEPSAGGSSLASAMLRHGKELSYNNLLDLDSALRLVQSFADPAACILKHNNPCGAAIGDDPASAFERAYLGDPVSAYGGIVGFNRRVDQAAAERMCQPGRFLEAVLAPGFDDAALEWLQTKPTWKNSVRLLEVSEPLGPSAVPPKGLDLRRISGGLLVQTWDELEPEPASGTVATRRQPTDDERRDLAFAWRVCAAVKSNAIVLVKDCQLVGVGAGQMSRLDSVRIAVEKAGPRAKGSVLASDAFFPFRDGPDLAASAGVTALIQPGGSKRDDDTIAACDEHGLAMVFTGRRHFRH
jgi:phosphoribosylaminoimidazolecarboxamide formyltransferase/IMP cyclohydrolase